MKYEVSNYTKEILWSIVHCAEANDAKIVQFCFTKGENQYYINPKRDLLITFKLDRPIKFDYPIPNLATFLETACKIDSDRPKTTIDKIVVPSKQDIKDFTVGKIVENTKFKYDQLVQTQKLMKYRTVNIISDSNKCNLRFQNHHWNWWVDDKDKKIIPLGQSRRRYRYVLNRKKLTKLFPTDYQLILREEVIQFQHKHLNFYFKPEVQWVRNRMRNWESTDKTITDKDLKNRYKEVGLI